MNKYSCVALLLSSYLFAGMASADPAVQFPKGNAAWEIEVRYTKAPVATPTPRAGATPSAFDLARRKAMKVQVVRVDKVKLTRITWNMGSATDEWTLTDIGVEFKQYANGDISPVKTGAREIKTDNFNVPSDENGFDWVNAGCLKEPVPISFQGKQCFHYVGKEAVPAYAVDESGTGFSDREAWIDSATLLPVALKAPNAYYLFTFATMPPVGPLVPPAEFQSKIAYYKKVVGVP